CSAFKRGFSIWCFAKYPVVDCNTSSSVFVFVIPSGARNLSQAELITHTTERDTNVVGEILRVAQDDNSRRNHATDDSFKRSATSAACSVRIISPRSPSITRSRLYNVRPMRWSVRRF